MKNTIAAVSVALLVSACALFPSYFDSNEQARITDIILLSQDDSVCARPDIATVARDIDHSAQWLKIYSASIPRNNALTDMTRNLAGVTQDFRTAYQKDRPPSQFYCRAKIKIIHEATTRMLDVSGRRPRP
jgi:hypothetical protein